MIYQGCKMEWYVYGAESTEIIDCDVNMDNDFIKVEYLYKGEHTVYSGHSFGKGHYTLRCVDNPGCTATLHCFENSKILEGSWEEESRGMWRIELKK